MTTTVANFSGLSSGIDTASIITQLTTVAQKPVTLLQGKDDTYNAKLATWQSFNASLLSLQSSVQTLNQKATFSAASASSSDGSVATITTLPGAALGDHSLTVTQIAKAQKVVSGSVASGATALGQSGSFTLNGKTVSVSQTDSLADLSVKINASGAGVTASVVNVGVGDFRLTLTSAKTGTANTLAAADTGGTVLSSLGLVTAGTASIRQPLTGTKNGSATSGAASLALLNGTQPIGALLGIASGSAPSGTFHLTNGGTGAGNEADITLDLNTASLSDLAGAINGAGLTGISAEVVTLPDAYGNLNRIHQLQITSTAGAAPVFTDANGVLGTVGVLQSQFTHPVTNAQDAKFNLDGLDLTRSSNAVADAVPGATITLLSGTAASPGTTTLSVSQNTDAIVGAVNNFATAFNAIQTFVTNQNKFTAPTDTKSGNAGSSPSLFGDSTLTQIQDQLTKTLSAVSGKTTLQDIGITLDQNGQVQVNSNTLTQALQTNPSTVSDLFGLSGGSDSPQVQFVQASAKTKATSGAGYSVVITQPGTQSFGAAGTAHAAGASSTAPETLTFGGGLFASPVRLTLPVGSSLQDTANLINTSSSLNTQVYASIDSGNHLVLSSQRFGSGTGFTVSSDKAADGTSSGIGPSLSVTAGQDVAGTINGEAAVGKGRTLSGNTGNATTEGLQLLVAATAPTPTGQSLGHVSVTHGVGDSLNQILTGILDPTNGSVAGAENSLNAQISDTQAQIQKIQDQVSTYTDYLRQLFSDMETRISSLKSAGDAFNAQVAGLDNSKKN